MLCLLVLYMVIFCSGTIGQAGETTDLNTSSWFISILYLSVYLTPDVVLYDPGGTPVKQVIACAPHSLNMTCPTDTKIDVILGNYGRFTITLCNQQVSWLIFSSIIMACGA